MLRELAKLHGISYDTIAPLYITHHAYNWYQDPNTCGATAGFGPGQFTGLYTHLTRPTARGRLIFAGEAMSIHHGWIVGSLESGWRAVYQFPKRFGLGDHIQTLVKEFGTIPDVDVEVKETRSRQPFVNDTVASLQVILGSLPEDEKPNVSLGNVADLLDEFEL